MEEEKRRPGRPKGSVEMNKELEQIDMQFKEFDNQVKDLTMDRMNEAPKLEVEPQTKLSQKEIDKNNQLYLKPKRAIGSREKFNEKYREDYNFKKEYVNFTAENREIIGETITLWVKPFAGMSAEEWEVPVNKPVWAPRYVAERIKGCSYHRLQMQENIATASDGMGKYYGQMVVDTTVQRLDALPVSSRKSIFMGANSFT
jgi:hypothetical protein